MQKRRMFMKIKSVLVNLLLLMVSVLPLYADDISFKLDENDTFSKFKIIDSNNNDIFEASQAYYYGNPMHNYDFFGKTLNLTYAGDSGAGQAGITLTSYAASSYYSPSMTLRASAGNTVGEMAQGYNNRLLGGISFQGVNSTNSSFVPGASIYAKRDGSTNSSSLAASLTFATYSSTGSMNSSQLFLNSGGNVGIGDSAPNVELDVDGDILADSYNDHSPLYVKNDALALIKGIKPEKGTEKSNGWAEVDHDSLPADIVTKHREVWVRSKATGKETKKGRLKLPKVKLEDREAYVANNYVTFEKEVPTRDLGAMLQLAIKGVQELTAQNEQLIKRIEKLEKAQTTVKS